MCNKDELNSSLKQYFVNGDRITAINNIFKYMNELYGHSSVYFDADRAMLKGEPGSYSRFLENEEFPVGNSDAEGVLEQLAVYFQRAVQWENPQTMINITPPANIVSIAANAYVNLFNPNFAQDEPSGYLMTTELAVIKFLSTLAGWDDKKSGGVFTFGGKGTNLYAGKMGLLKAMPSSRIDGISNSDVCIISNEKSHPCHVEISDWLGIGRNACIKIPTDKDGRIIITELESVLRKKIESGEKIGCIIANGGTTNEIIVDPIKQIVELRNKLVKEYALKYIPHVHVDSVIGWAWLNFKHYDFEKNRLNMTENEKRKIKSLCDRISEVVYADSFGVDFHKTGFCPYLSSCIMVKNINDLLSLGGKENTVDVSEMKYGEYSPFEWTLELTRSAHGPVSAYTAYKLFGAEGFQELIYNLFSSGEYIRKRLAEDKEFEVINNDTEGFATLFVILPPDDKRHYSDYVSADEGTVKTLLEYNNQFYLFLTDKFNKGEIGFRITFSKSYKPYGSKMKTGCLKIYQMSPVADKEDFGDIVKQIIELKKEYDMSSVVYKEDFAKPTDFVYR